MKNIYHNILRTMLLFIVVAVFAQNNVGWEPLGPVQYPVNNIGQINGIARISQIKFHPTDPKTMYTVTSMGGLFISKDEGQNWMPTGTDFIPQARNASVCIDYTDDRVLYFSTGDPQYYSQNSGIWKSTDGGKTWTQSNSGIGNRMAVEMLMSPLDRNVIIAATNDGIWKTTNGGASWSVKKAGGQFTDMLFKAVANTSTIFAANHNEFWVSNDMGETWSRITISGTSGIERGGRIAVTKADPNVVYLSFVGNFDAGTSTPVFKSTNGGSSFTPVKNAGAPNLNGYDGNSGGQGNYNYGIAADPTNANIVYACGHIIWKSTNGGSSWTQATRSWATRLHTDMHQIIFSPYKPNHMYNANDGGIWLSTDGGFVWQVRSNGLAAMESYCGAQSHILKDMVMVGSQDNGAVIYRNNYWATNMGGDVHQKIEADYLSSGHIYLLNGNGRRKSTSNGGESGMNFPVAGNDGNGNDKEMEFTPKNTNLGFVSYREVYRTTNLSANPPTWTSLTPGLNSQIKALGASPADANLLYAVTEDRRVLRFDNVTTSGAYTTLTAPENTNVRASIVSINSNPNVVYITCGNRVYRSDNKGANWTNVSGTLPAVNIFKIVQDRFTTNESVYIATALGVYYKNNTMSDWINYSKDLPSLAEKSRLFIYADGTSGSEVRVVTGGRGVWRRATYNNVILRPADNPATVIAGLRYEYFEGFWNQIPNFNSLTPVKTGTATVIDLSQRNRDDEFGLRFKGYVSVPTDGIYNFHVNSDDGCKIYIGDRVIVNNDGSHGNETEVTGSIGLKAGRHIITVEYFEGRFGQDLLVQYSGPGIAKQTIPSSALSRLPEPAICGGTGSISYDIWRNQTGGLSSVPWDSNPTEARTLGDMEGAQDNNDSYASRIRGFICAPYTGKYTFWVASDDDSELRLSTDANPANKRRIANLAGATSFRNWYQNSTQQSVQIDLVAGQKYYIEVIQRDGGGDDHLSVGWQLPSGEFERPIPANRLSPFSPNALPTVSITKPANNSTFAAGSNIALEATANDPDGSISKVQYFYGSTPIGTATAAPYAVSWNNVAAGTYQLTAVATDNSGATANSTVINVTVNGLRNPENPVLTVAGLDYKFYQGTWSALPDFSTLTPTKTGTVTNYDLTPRTVNDLFAFVYTGFINVPADGNYTFYTSSDDGSKLYIGTTQVVNNDGLHGTVEANGTIGLKAGKHAITVSFFEQGGGESLTVSYSSASITKQVIPSTALFRLPPPVACSGTGTILREVWSGVTGNTVAEIPVNTVPSTSGTVTLFQGPTDAADNYGARYRGYVCPPFTGAYTFWIAGDDDTELWLSTNDQVSSKVKIAEHIGWVNPLAWDSKPSQKSVAINLTAGQKYYIEALQKEGIGGDHLAVGWQLPTGDMERPITGNRISPYANVSPTISLASNGTNFNAPAAINLTATAADADGSVLKVEFYNGTALLDTKTAAPYTTSWTNVAAGTYSVTAKVYDNSGVVVTSLPVSITVVNPSTGVATVYKNCEFNVSDPGYSASLEVGNYNLAALQALGVLDNDISSLKVTSGYEVILYTENNFTGTSVTYKADDNCVVNEGINDLATSLIVRLVTNGAPTVTISAPATGATVTTGTTITFTANANDADGSIAKVQYFHGTTPIGSATTAPYTVTWAGFGVGTYSITAVATDDASLQSTSPAISVIAKAPNKAPTVSIATPANGATITTGTTVVLTASANDPDGTVAKVEYFYGTKPIGSATSTPFSVNWIGFTAGTYSLTAIATDNNGLAATSTAISVTAVAPNKAPTVSITTPTAGNSFTTGTTITVSANATDTDGSIAKVEFFSGSTPIGQSATSPYTISWTGFAAGTHNLIARATDNQGAITSSATVTITAVAPNTPPTVTITGPPNNTNFTAPAVINFTVNATDNGTVAKVEYFQGSTPIGQSTTSPFSIAWSNVAAGTYTITAKATDNLGLSTTSSAITLVVKPADNCGGTPAYVENGGYVAGSKVKNGTGLYECRPWPNSGWCNGASWAYAPGTGAYWTDAWTSVGTCGSAHTAADATLAEMSAESFPNPFEGSTTIKFKTISTGKVSVVVLNNQGVKVADLFAGEMKDGSHELVFNGHGLAEGSYFCKIITPDDSKVVTLSKVNRPKN